MRFIGFISTAVLLACESTPSAPPGSTTTTTTAYVSAVTNDHAIDEITNARCAREWACDNIGQGRVWRDYDACTRGVRLSMRDMLTGQQCTSGVAAFQLSSCLEDIRNVRCAATQGTVVSWRTCAEAKLCR
jgi:hypothetical protein